MKLNQRNSTVPGIDPKHDPYVYGGQVVLESKWTPKFDTSLGVAAFDIAYHDSLSALVQPFYNSGNSRSSATGQLLYNFNPIIGTASATYTLESFPFYAAGFR